MLREEKLQELCQKNGNEGNGPLVKLQLNGTNNLMPYIRPVSTKTIVYPEASFWANIPFSQVAPLVGATPEKIKKDEVVCGVTGSVVELQGQTKIVTPTTEQQVITPDQGYNGLTQVTVEAVEDLTPQIQAQEQIIAQLQEEVASKSTEAPTLELYDVLDLQHTCVASYDTDYIPNENTEIFVEYEDWYTYVSSTNTVNLFGVRYGTRQGRATSSTWTNACGFGSYNYGNFKFGDKELRTSAGAKLADIEGKIRLKLNKNGIYKYNYNTSQYETIALFDSTPTIDTMQHTIALFEEKQIMTIIDPQETYINHNNANSQTLKFHFMEIYENGVLKAKYVPAKLGDEVGIYDMVAKKMLERITPLEVYNETNN